MYGFATYRDLSRNCFRMVYVPHVWLKLGDAVPARGTVNRAEGFVCAPITTNHLAGVFRMDAQLKHDHVLSLD